MTRKETGAKSKPKKRTAQRAEDKQKAPSRSAAQEKPSPDSRGHQGPSLVVALGASAGGLEAFERFFTNMPADSGMAFIALSHLDPTHASILPELIQKRTAMKVSRIEDGMTVEPNQVYVIPPDTDLGILHGALQLVTSAGADIPRSPINYFLRLLAEDQGERAVAIILSGMGTDGALGVKAIKGQLGMVMVQAPDSSRYDGMPRSAIDTGFADYVLPPEEMPARLLEYGGNWLARPTRLAPLEEVPSTALQKIFMVLRSRTGHDFSAYKQSTIARRISRRMGLHRLDDTSSYVRFLQRNAAEVDSLIKDLLIGVTGFFRDPEAFDILKNKALLSLLQDKPNDYSLRVWVPGCSSGEEAYSVAIVLRECMEALGRILNVQVFATDIDADAVETARTGIYSGSIAIDIDTSRLERFFEKDGETYRVKREIRETLVFAAQSVIRDPPFTKLDLICCRNLLIYLNSDAQKKLIPLFHYALRDGGILFLGSSETVGASGDLFSAVDNKWKIYKRKPVTAGQRALDFPIGRPMAVYLKPPPAENAPARPDELVEKKLLSDYTPPSVLINRKGAILYIHGRTGAYLEPAPGTTSAYNIFEMAREGLKLLLPAVVRKAHASRAKVTERNAQILQNGTSRLVDVSVEPLVQDHEPDLFLVVFADSPSAKPGTVKRKKTTEAPGDVRARELEQELAQTKENLYTIVEELETANEELQSSNEEYQSANEELQSANEELNSSREELQSLNEELETVNAELQSKNFELVMVSNDMKNLMDSMEIPTVFLDNELCIRRFTAPVKTVMSLRPSDIGRPITELVQKLNYKGLGHDVRQVLDTLAPKDIETQAEDGRWHLIRIRPYRTADNVIDGVAVTFVDIDAQKKATEQLSETRNLAEAIVDTVQDALLVLDTNLRVVSANRRFYEIFRMGVQRTEGRFIYDLGDRQWDIAPLRQLLERVLPGEEAFEGFKVEHRFPNIGHKTMLLSGRKLRDKKRATESILLAITDLSGQVDLAEPREI